MIYFLQVLGSAFLVDVKWPNWVDLVIIILILRGCYVGFGRGFLTELLNFAGAICIAALTINYARPFFGFIEPWWAFGPVMGNFIVFWVFFLICVLAIHFVNRRLMQVFKWERLHWTIQGIGLVFGGLRGLWWSAFFLIALVSTEIPALQESAQTNSVLGPHLLPPAQKIFEQTVKRFPGSENRNEGLVPPASEASKKKK